MTSHLDDNDGLRSDDDDPDAEADHDDDEEVQVTSPETASFFTPAAVIKENDRNDSEAVDENENESENENDISTLSIKRSLKKEFNSVRKAAPGSRSSSKEQRQGQPTYDQVLLHLLNTDPQALLGRSVGIIPFTAKP